MSDNFSPKRYLKNGPDSYYGCPACANIFVENEKIAKKLCNSELLVKELTAKLESLTLKYHESKQEEFIKEHTQNPIQPKLQSEWANVSDSGTTKVWAQDIYGQWQELHMPVDKK